MPSVPARLAAVPVAAVLLCPAVACSAPASAAPAPAAPAASTSAPGPFTAPPAPPRPLAPGEVRVVIDGHPAIARARSTLASKDDRYSVANLFDSRLDTAWVEGSESDGYNQWVELEFDESVEVDAFLLAPGYGKSPTTFVENLAPADISIRYSQTPVETKGYGLQDLVVSYFRLPMAPDCQPEPTPAAWGPRVIVLSEPIRARTFRAKVGDPLPNPAAKYRDLAISEWRPVFAGKPPSAPPGWQPISAFAVDLLRSLRNGSFDPRLLSPDLVIDDPFLTVAGDAPMMQAHRSWLDSIGAKPDAEPLANFVALAVDGLRRAVTLVPTSSGHALVGERTFVHGGKYARMAFDYALVVEPAPKGPLAVSAMRALATPMKCADKALPDLSRLPAPPFVPPPAPGATPDPRCPFHMAWLPGGSFKLGATGKTVKVEPFCIDRTEVSAADYRFCAELGGDDVNRPGRCSSDVGRSFPYTFDSSWGDMPINGVNWEQARQYCNTHGERLPTEAEWEWAARGGPAGNTYPWGNDPPSNQPCWSGPGNDAPGGKPDRPCPIQSHPLDVTPQGVYDMAGNLYEWTATSAGRDGKVIRSASWISTDAEFLRTPAREPAEAANRSISQGFRCVKSPDFVGR